MAIVRSTDNKNEFDKLDKKNKDKKKLNRRKIDDIHFTLMESVVRYIEKLQIEHFL